MVELLIPSEGTVWVPESHRQSRTAEAFASYLLGLNSPLSKKTMFYCLRVMAGRPDPWAFPWDSLSRTDALAVQEKVLVQFARTPRTAQKYMAAFRGLMREMFRSGVISAERYTQVTELPKIRGGGSTAGHYVDRDCMAKMFSACDMKTARGSRDAAMLALLYGAGLRVSEAATIPGTQVKAHFVEVLGKGNRTRTTFFLDNAPKYLGEWRQRRRGAPNFKEGLPFLLALGARGQVLGRGIQGRSLEDACRRLSLKAGVPDLTPHDLRRSYATALLDAGADLASVQRLMGHANVTTTTLYDRRGDTAAQKTARLITMNPDDDEDTSV